MMRARYGASPLHLAGQFAVLAVAAYAISRVTGGHGGVNFLAWLLGGALLHDLLLLPLYSLGDAVVRRLARRRRGGVRLLNHVRVPLLISALLLLAFFPLILDRAPGNYERATGREPPDYLLAWVLVTAALFAGSALVYVIRAARARAAGGRPPSTPPPRAGPRA